MKSHQDPRLQQIHTEVTERCRSKLCRSIAAEAAHKIKVITEERDADVKAIYQDYKHKAAAIRAESSTDNFVETLVLPSEPYPQRIKN